MSVRRPLAASALLATAVLTLTSCYATAEPEPEPSSSVSASAGAPAASTAPGAAPAPAGTEGTATAPSGTEASASARATGCMAAQRPGHEVIKAGAATAARVTATATIYVCGPEVTDDGYYRESDTAANHPFAAGATAELVTTDSAGAVSTAAVPLASLISHVNDCAAQRRVARPYGCFGGFYDVTVDRSGAITKVSEVYHP
ncbi:hypothetical protein [Streptomyces sp.]|uniref:hypothetical protein n=1 Tax=Streptomyces sp. TaxID=1931 RepID=UPI002F4193A2